MEQLTLLGTGSKYNSTTQKVPALSKHLKGIDSLLSSVQMPKGIPVSTFAIDQAGAANESLFAVSLLALSNSKLLPGLMISRKHRQIR